MDGEDLGPEGGSPMTWYNLSSNVRAVDPETERAVFLAWLAGQPKICPATHRLMVYDLADVPFAIKSRFP